LKQFTIKHLVILIILSTTVIHCKNNPNLGKPWNNQEYKFFDDGIDLIKDFSNLSGEWGKQQEDLLEGRIQLSDFIAIIKPQSVQTHTDLDGKQTKLIYIKIISTIYGDMKETTISLESAESSPGYELILRHERHISEQLILFIRLFEIENENENENKPEIKKTGHHFHLSPASASIAKIVNDRCEKRIAQENKKNNN